MFENWRKLVSSYKIDLVQEKISFYKLINANCLLFNTFGWVLLSLSQLGTS